jgi:hypothetical protein
VAAHVDRKSFGVIGQLGFFPAEAGFDAVELSSRVPAGREHAAEYAAYGLPVLRSSDAHFVHEVGAARTAIVCEHPGFDELALALRGLEGRHVGDA